VALGDGFADVRSFSAWLDFLDRSQVDQVRLLGGEPTLHPRFPELVDLARARGKRVMVFSNGLIPEPALTCLEALAPTECAVLVNVNHPDLDGTYVHQRRCTTIRRLGARALLGFNIYRTDFQTEFLLSIIAETGCQPTVRLGMAQPCLSGRNQHIRPNQYRVVGARVVRLARQAHDAGVVLEFDCGFVRCMFTQSELDLLDELGTDAGWRCSPVLDIDVRGRVVHCYPLSRFMHLALTPEVDATTLRCAFLSHTRPYRQAGVFQACSTCLWKQSGECSGGCLAVIMRRFRHSSFSISIPPEGSSG
jgi:MoaA/NifB/PqqE/SkfB family radical SAM enzyme